MNPVSIERFEAKYTFASQSNASTFENTMLDLITKKDFQIVFEQAEEDRLVTYGPSDSFNRGLVAYNDITLRGGYLSNIYTDLGLDEKIVEQRLSDDGMTNGVPDVI